MTDEEKAKQLYHKYGETNFTRGSAAFNAAMEMATWQKQQLIEKALAYLQDKFYFNNVLYGIVSTDFNAMEEMYEDFIKYMKGE